MPQPPRMRRSKQQMADPADILDVLERAEFCRLGLCDDGRPYVVPVCFCHEDGRLYVHGATEGHKLDIIGRNDRVCFQADVGAKVVVGEKPCNSTVHYRSVIGFGRASVVRGPDEKRRALALLAGRYAGDGREPDPGPLLDRTAVIRIDIESMTGKANPPVPGKDGSPEQ